MNQVTLRSRSVIHCVTSGSPLDLAGQQYDENSPSEVPSGRNVILRSTASGPMPAMLPEIYKFNFLSSFSLDSQNARLLSHRFQVTEHGLVSCSHVGTVSELRKQSKTASWGAVSGF